MFFHFFAFLARDMPGIWVVVARLPTDEQALILPLKMLTEPPTGLAASRREAIPAESSGAIGNRASFATRVQGA